METIVTVEMQENQTLWSRVHHKSHTGRSAFQSRDLSSGHKGNRATYDKAETNILSS
jgi:hypothetical protein